MEQLQKIPQLLANNALVREASDFLGLSQYDPFNDPDQKFRPKMFKGGIKPQAQSRLLSIPTEVRLMIYPYVFATPSSNPHAGPEKLSLLRTCRLINQEAVNIAFSQVRWCIETKSNLNYRTPLSTLGPLTKQLRHLEISMRLAKIDTVGPNNPFLLTQLPLDVLKINFTDTETTGGHRNDWRRDIDFYHKFISALLYRSRPEERGGETVPIHKHTRLRMQRHLEVGSWAFQPTREEFLDVVARSMAKEVIVRCKEGPSDLLWLSFAHFDMQDRQFKRLNVTNKSEGQVKQTQKLILFYDEGGYSFLRFGESGTPVA